VLGYLFICSLSQTDCDHSKEGQVEIADAGEDARRDGREDGRGDESTCEPVVG
jgi:hypothetical protein